MNSENTILILAITAVICFTITCVSKKLKYDREQVEQVLDSHYSGGVRMDMKDVHHLNRFKSTEGSLSDPIESVQLEVSSHFDPFSPVYPVGLDSVNWDILASYSDHLGNCIVFIVFLDMGLTLVGIPIFAAAICHNVVGIFNPGFAYSSPSFLYYSIGSTLINATSAPWKKFRYSPPVRGSEEEVFSKTLYKNIIFYTTEQHPLLLSLESRVMAKMNAPTFGEKVNNLKSIKEFAIIHNIDGESLVHVYMTLLGLEE